MANCASALKRLRSNKKKRDRNRYQMKSMRTAIKKIMRSQDKQEISESINKTISMLAKGAKKNLISLNRASRQTSRLMQHLNQLA